MCGKRHTSCSTSQTSLPSLSCTQFDRFSHNSSCDVRQALLFAVTHRDQKSSSGLRDSKQRWSLLHSLLFTLLIKIFIQSGLISNILPIVQQIDCTDLRIIFSLHILLLSTSFLLLILLLQGERSGHKREWHKSTWRRYRRTTKERRLFTGWKDFKVRSTSAGVCRLHCLVPASCDVTRRNSRYGLTRVYTYRVRYIVRVW